MLRLLISQDKGLEIEAQTQEAIKIDSGGEEVAQVVNLGEMNAKLQVWSHLQAQ